MTIHRNPVPGSKMKEPLRCVDLHGGSGCAAEFAGLSVGTKFLCPNVRASNGECKRGAFLYPRKHTMKKGAKKPHYHQGIDLGAKTGTPILSVSSGTVVDIEPDDKGSYGRTVAVLSKLPDGRWVTFFYAHCDKVLVAKGKVDEGQQIATVGHSGTAGSDAPHLHFEVIDCPGVPEKFSNGRVPTVVTVPETKLGDAAGPRLDPLEILELLGPWGPRQVFLANGEEAGPKKVDSLLSDVESAKTGGYFPLGANNVWHGGVHLKMKAGSKVVAPFDGTIVAARLDPDPKAATGAFGSTNFILLRHEIPQAVFDAMQGVAPAPDEPGGGKKKGKGKSKAKVETVGRGGTNPPDVVAKIKKRLHELTTAGGNPYYDPADAAALEDGTVDDELIAAIDAFQATLPSPYKDKTKPWPDGVIAVGQTTWNAMFAGTSDPEDPGAGKDPDGPTPAPPPDRERTIYCLLMHLASRELSPALRKEVPWLGKVALEPGPGEPTPAKTKAEIEKERAEDAAEAAYSLTGDVGKPDAEGNPTPGAEADVEWVQKRLKRFGYYDGDIDGEYTDAFRAALQAFQKAHVAHYATHPPDGHITKGKGTEKALRKTRDELFGGGGKGAQIDPVLVHRLTERDPEGTARVVTNLDVKVTGQETLWFSGSAAGLEAEFRATIEDQIHWEIFSEHSLMFGWLPLEDDSNDLSLDIPSWLFSMVEIHELPPNFARDEFLTPEEIADFYGSGRQTFLRTSKCRFRSEWGLDVDAAVARLKEDDWNTSGLADDLRPYMWWDQVAAGVEGFPASPVVWHYNPIQFVGAYQMILDALAPKPVEPKNPELFSTLVAHVRFSNAVPMEDAVVVVLAGGVIVASTKTDSDGRAMFSDLPVGPYTAYVQDSAHPMLPAPVVAHEVTAIEFLTEHEGPELAKGRITIIVRKHTKVVAPGIKVALLRTDGSLAGGGTTNGSGQVKLEALEPGNYTLGYADAPLVALPIASGKNKTKTVYLLPPMGELEVVVERSGSAVADITVAALADGAPAGGGTTDASGRTVLELREGKYQVAAGNSDLKKATVKGGKRKTVTLALKEAQPSPPGP